MTTRSEHEEVDDHPRLPRISGGHSTTLSLAKYLDQPEMVEELLREMADMGDEVENEALEEVAGDLEEQTETTEDDLSIETALRQAKEPPRSVLPILSTVSPRTRDGLARLPPPNTEELRRIQELERLAEQGSSRHALYTELKRVTGNNHRVSSRRGRQRRIAPPVLVPKQDTRTKTMKATSPTSSKPRNASKRQREEQIGMALEDRNALLLSLPVSATLNAVPTFSTPPILPTAVRQQLRADHHRLVNQQHVAEKHERAAKVRVEQTLSEIKQFIPLEVIYAFGKGEFASPAQQRATQVLFRVGARLKNNLVVQAMLQWKQVVTSIKHELIVRAALMLQCWWRQVLAKRVLVSRRRIRRELERRQKELLRLLANREDKAASTITRTIRRYAAIVKVDRLRREDAAARRLQRFWRQQLAHWMAIRNLLRKKKRNAAAVMIQTQWRGCLARKKRRLLQKIKTVGTILQNKEIQRQKHFVERKRHGAAIAIQSAFRLWSQRRIDALRRRRAQFDREKTKIVYVQAFYRGQKARRFTRKHRTEVPRAVLVIQRAWRCYKARIKFNEARLRRQADRQALLESSKASRKGFKARAIPQIGKKAPWGTLLQSRGNKNVEKGPSPREVAAATKMQAIWRGRKLRQRVKHDQAREREQVRRAVRRKLNRAALCIQRHVRGIQGRARVWDTVVHRSAARIQGVWRGFRTRRDLIRMRRALKAIERMQKQWRLRRQQNLQAQRTRAARQIQRAARRMLARKWLYTAVRRQQYLAEEQAMGKALMQFTRKRIKDDLLLQSFVFPTLHLDIKKDDALLETKTQDVDLKSVQRPLYKFDSGRHIWKRRGCDGVWHELYRDITGNSFEIDNSRFARFLKALPNNFINQKSFPTQNIDLIFAKMKEPRARTIVFARFNKAMVVVWQEKFVPSDGKKKSPNKPTAPDQDGLISIDKQQQHELCLRFMHDFVLPSTLQNGKYRKMLERLVNERLEWAVNVLRRFSNRITGKERHIQFLVVYRQHQLEKQRARAATTLQRHYRRYQHRAKLKSLLAGLFIEFIDYKGRSVRFRNIGTQREITRRPMFLQGVRCQKIIPLPFPGEEFSAFCERHESPEAVPKRAPARVYCLECEDAMCSSCFARDHDKRETFQAHQRREIEVCSHCGTETATWECLECGNGKVPFCDVCFPFVHAAMEKDGVKVSHRSSPLVVMCIECDAKVAQWQCDVCDDVYCKRCLTRLHGKGERQSHACHRLSYFSVLRQQAQERRTIEAQNVHDQKRREREARRAEEEKERLRRERCATMIQAMIRSFLARQRGKAYMKLVRQTNAAKAQRLKDERIRSSWGYRIKNVVGLAPALKSDTQQEILARRQKFDNIKSTLFFFKRRDSTTGKDTNPKKAKRWTKRARLLVEKAAKSWCISGVQVKILRGEWKNAVGSILSTQNLFTTGFVVVFIPLANRAVVVNWEHLVAYDEDEILRQPYVPPTRRLSDAAHEFHGKLSQVIETAARRARLMYLQTIEFHDIVQYAWVVEYNKAAQQAEYWNVVLNRRTFDAPKAMMAIERMEPEERDRLDRRVAIAKSKLQQLLNPFHPMGKVKLATRRNAVVPISRSLYNQPDPQIERLRMEAEAMQCARFWQDTILPDTQFGSRHVNRFLNACSTAPHSTKHVWLMMRFFQWLDLHDSDAFANGAKAFFRKADDSQLYIVDEMVEMLEKNELKEANETFARLIKLKEETLQLLVANAAQKVAEQEDVKA
ncbi:hypothetical protein Poli38472_004109 [Pythium oligandrum]|uniref:B box-type domain-containing protein n=1 Tax=Pythium oligandrum TaxID=41045 RepID=A0A8K1FMJ7_PYTOL|nr:hypothetical protein Poli38472_004109 [Pythium oligandrum]|eukprot:TMW66344.1 hypothetical protein Poli38472_004109 [Pythium oligandrum]